MARIFWSLIHHLWLIAALKEHGHSVVKPYEFLKEAEHLDFYAECATWNMLAANSIFVKIAVQIKHLCRPPIT